MYFLTCLRWRSLGIVVLLSLLVVLGQGIIRRYVQAAHTNPPVSTNLRDILVRPVGQETCCANTAASNFSTTLAAATAGSVLVFPYYVSTDDGTKNTTISLSNVGTQIAGVHLFFVQSCLQADVFLTLNSNDCYSFSMASFDPGATGFLVAVAIDVNGNPIQNNSLIGHAIVKDGDYEGVYDAEVLRANSSAPATNNGNGTATLFFDGSRYEQLPNQFSANIQSPVSVPGQKVITVGLQGSLSAPLSGAAQVGTGQITNASGTTGSFSGWLQGQCQAMATLSTSNPLMLGGLSSLLPSGQTGTMRLGIGGGVGVLLTPRTSALTGTIQPLVKIGYTNATLIVPVYPPSFFAEFLSMRQPTISPEKQAIPQRDSVNGSALIAEATSGQTFNVKGSNPTFLPIIGGKGGDTIYIEATLHDAQPGKNQQNRPLLIQSSLGFSARVDNYELPKAFTYEMKTGCEIFSAYIQNASSTESATITVRIEKKPRLSTTTSGKLTSVATKQFANASLELAPGFGSGGGSGGGGGTGGGGDNGIDRPICGSNPVYESYELRPPSAGGNGVGFIAGVINYSPISGVIESRPATRIGDWRIRGTGGVFTYRTDQYSKIEKNLSVGDKVKGNGQKNGDGSIQVFSLVFDGAVVCTRSLGYQIRGAATVASNAINNLSLDPPDPNFTIIAQPEIPALPRLYAKDPLPVDPAQRQRVEAVVNSYNAFIENQLLVIAYAKAMFISINRADGALEAGDTIWEDKQVQSIERYQAQLAYLLSLQPSLRVNLHRALLADGIVSPPVSAADILSGQTAIATNGLPALFIELLEALGADSEMVKMIRDQIIVQEQKDFPGFPDSLIEPDLLEALKEAAQELLPARFLNTDGSIKKADVGLEVNASSLLAKPGNDLTYNVTVENFGVETATNVILTVELPTNADFVSVMGSQCKKQGNSLTCEIPSLIKGARNGFQIIMRPTAEGTILSKFHVVASQPDSHLFNNSDVVKVLSAVTNTPVGQNVCLGFGRGTVCFTNVTVAGNTTVTPIQAASAGNLPGGYLLNGLNLAFDIRTTATFSGPVTVTFHDVPITRSEDFARLRLLHGENGQLVDRTILAPDSPAPNFAAREISARVMSLSPFVLAVAPAMSIFSNPGVTGSVLVFPLYTSEVNNFAAANTRLNFTNTDPTRLAYVHVFFVSNRDCTVADMTLCLTPNQTASFLASEFDPSTTGYVIAVAVDARGCPINFNNLIGSEFVKLASGHTANLQAQAITALPTGVFTCNAADTTTTLKFDGVQYSLLPHTLAVNNLPSPLDGNDTLLILDRIGGDLNDGVAARLSNLAGLVYNDREIGYSFVQSASQCQLIGRLNTGFPRTSPPLTTIIPKGRTGWLRFNQSDNGAMIGVMINLNPQGFNQGHYLHVLRYTSTTLTLPIYPPVCSP